jgi:hypothetical protein
MAQRFDRPRPASAEHGIVYWNDAEFCGWPFYCGLWKVGNGDLVVGFKKIANSYRDPGDVTHTKLTMGKGELFVMRSRDSGRTWDPATRQGVFRLDTTADQISALGPEDYDAEGPLAFGDADVLIMSGAVPALLKPDSRAWLRASTDGGQTWRRPILLPLCGLRSLTGHGSSMVRADGMNLLGLTTTSADGWSNRPLVYASTDGLNWRFLSFITPADHDGAAIDDRSGPLIFGAIGSFYPRLIALADGRILASVRFQRDARDVIWTEVFESGDGGRTWRILSRVNDWGAPGDIVQMADGRIACVYGYRVAPQGIRARVSEDGGRTWGREIILRDDGGSWDLGYPRVIEAEAGRLLTVYYMNRLDDPIQMNGGVRHIAWTTFTPD